MSVGNVDIRSALLPPNDGAMARAFQDLDEKLKAWNAAVAAFHGQVAINIGQSAAVARSVTAAPEPIEKLKAVENAQVVEKPPAAESRKPESTKATSSKSAAEAVEKVRSRVVETVVEPRPEVIPEPPPVAPLESTQAAPEAEGPQDDETLLAALNPEQAEAIRSRFAFFKGSKTIRELIQEYEDEADDEESLLMSLDPEFAKAVRVKYRLYNGRKTLREVIAEVENSQPKQNDADKKSWWRR